ncbi:MAG: FHA domain-containing protein, partial [Thermoanaerobaculia bacterium]
MTNDVFRYVLSAEGREVELLDGEATLGRSRTSTIRLEHESVSRSHALLTLNQGEAVVKDLNSSNGTYVRGKRITRETRLQNGDHVQLGAAVIDLRIVPPSLPSDRTTHLGLDELPPQPADQPQAAAPRPPSGIPYEPVPEFTNPVVPAPPPAVFAPDEMSASELFGEIDRKSPAPAAEPGFREAFSKSLRPSNQDEISTVAPPESA